jgi:hypothetical protein
MDSFTCRKCTYSLTMVGWGEYKDPEGHVITVRGRDGNTVTPSSKDAVCPRCGREGSIERVKSETDLEHERKGRVYPAAIAVSVLVLVFFLTWVGCPPRM